MKIHQLQYVKQSGWSTDLPEIDQTNSLLLLFFSPSLQEENEVFDSLAKKYPKARSVGCSTAGEIFQDLVYDDSISLMIIEFEQTSIKVCSSQVKNAKDSFAAGKSISQALNANHSLKGIFVLSDGLNINGSELTKGLSEELPDTVVVTGGLAGDGSNFKSTCVLENFKIKRNNVVAVGFYGDSIQLQHGSQGGWDIFGPERIITSSEGNIVYEIDGQPALDLYEKYLGDKAKELPASALLFPIQIRKSEESKKRLVRTVLSVNKDSKSLTFAGDLPEGYLAQLMIANFDRLIDGASKASLQANEFATDEEAIACLAISCVGRRLVLGERIDEETEATLLNLPANTKQIGFYSYGELSPYVKGKTCELHNQTMTLTLISETKK